MSTPHALPSLARRSPRMTPAERRATASLASIYGLRLLGMFVILPVFALYAQTLPGGASHTLIGIALGAYGLTQALLQIPFGWASDRWGRKPVIYSGLVIFAVGSFIAAVGAPTSAGSSSGAACRARAPFPPPSSRSPPISRATPCARARWPSSASRSRATFAASLVVGPGAQGLDRRARHLRADRRARARRHRGGPLRGARCPSAAPTDRAVAPRQLARVAARPAAAAPELRHLRAARGADGAVHASAVRAARQRPREPSGTGSSTCPVLVVSIAADAARSCASVDRPERGKPLMNAARRRCCWLPRSRSRSRCTRSRRCASRSRCSSPRSTCSKPCCLRWCPSTRTRDARGAAIGVNSSAQFLGAFAGAAIGGWLAGTCGRRLRLRLLRGADGAWLVATATMAAPCPLRHQLLDGRNVRWPRSTR